MTSHCSGLQTDVMEPLNYLGISYLAHKGVLWPTIFDLSERQWLQDNYKPTDNEIWIVTYAKNGTTLTQQLCHEIMHRYYIKTKSEDHKYYASNAKQFNRNEWIEASRSLSKQTYTQIIDQTRNSFRFWKTHSRLQLLPCAQLPKKMIICCRNPKDALVSFYHHHNNHRRFSYTAGFDTFFTMWVSGLVENGSYFDFYKEYWNLYSNKNALETEILWLSYEDLVKDTASKTQQILKLIQFIGVGDVVNSTEDLDYILNRTSINTMRRQYNTKDEAIAQFVRKGQIGDWKNHFTNEQSEIIEALIKLHFTDTEWKYYLDLKAKQPYLCGTLNHTPVSSVSYKTLLLCAVLMIIIAYLLCLDI